MGSSQRGEAIERLAGSVIHGLVGQHHLAQMRGVAPPREHRQRSVDDGLAALAAGLACFIVLWAIGVGGQRTRRAIALRLGAGAAVLGLVLIVLAG
jgi:hypothetical protein